MLSFPRCVNSRGELLPSHGASRRRLGDKNFFFSFSAATVEFAQRQYSVLESGVSVTATLNLTGILDQATTLRYAPGEKNIGFDGEMYSFPEGPRQKYEDTSRQIWRRWK
jgi:hypothetical protein